MRYPRVMSAFFNTPLALRPEKMAEIQAFLERKAGEPFTMDDPDGPRPTAGPRERSGVEIVGRTALLPLFGVIGQRMNLFMYFSGGTSTEEFGAALDSLVADKQVKNIVIVVDSPGGSVFGTAELGAKILAARDQKRIIAIADSMAASGAYWLSSQASELVVTPGGMVGSIGVIASHLDESKAEELAGLKTTIIHAGRYKAELNSSQSLSPEAQDHLQATVDQYYAMFVAAVAKGRGVTETRVKSAEWGQGRMMLAQDAKAAGMVDRVATLEQVLKRLGEDVGGASAADLTPGLTARLAAAKARGISVI